MQPTRYFVEYVHRWIEDEGPETTLVNVDTLAAAQRIYGSHPDDLPQIFERTNIQDVTPKGDPRGLLWSFEEVLIRECP